MTIWAYTGSSPSVKSGSSGHILGWEKETRGNKKLDKGDSRGKSALWVRGKGFISNDPGKMPKAVVQGAFDRRLPTFDQMMWGTTAIDQGFLNTFYTIVQVMKIHPTLDAAYKKQAEELIPKVLRMRYWAVISKTFATTYAKKIETMYKALGITPKALGAMSRPDFIKEAALIVAAINDTTPPTVVDFVTNVLKQGLVDLDEKVIPNTWI